MGQFGRNISLWSWVLLLLLLPLLFFPPLYLGVALFIILFLVAVRRWAFGYFLPSTPLNLALLIMLGALLVSYFAMFDEEVSLSKLAGLLVGIALFFSVVHFSKERSVWPIVVMYVLIGVAIATVGLFGSQWPAPFEFLNATAKVLPSGLRFVPGTTSGVINLNELAGVLSWIAPFLLATSIGLRRKLIHRNAALYILLVTATLYTITLLIATSSRGGILAFTIGAILVLALYATGRWRLVLGSVIVPLLLILYAYTSNQVDKDIVGDALGLSGRIEIWSRALLALQDHPITGVSVNGFRRVVHEVYPLFGIASDVDIAHAHNHLLQTGLDLGLPGLIGYLAIWLISGGLLLVTIRSLIRRGAHHHSYFALASGLAGALLAGWVFGLFDAVALGARPGFMWWMLIGLTVAVHYEVLHSGKHLRIYRRVSVDRMAERAAGGSGRSADALRESV